MNEERKSGLLLFATLAVLYGAIFGARALWVRWVREVRLAPGKAVYRHYDFVEVRLWSRDPVLNERWSEAPPRVRVLKDGREVLTIAGLREAPLAYDAKEGAWAGKWPCPWNAPAGVYELDLLGAGDLGDRLVKSSFRIEYRKPHALPRRMAVVTLESVNPLRTMKVTAPDGRKTDWRGLVDWVEYVGADAFWMLGGQTPGQRPGQVWVEDNLAIIPEVARECHRRGIKFGVYAMCYLTMSKERLPNYDYALEVKDGRPVPTRAISIRDANRPKDVAALLKRFHDIPEVDMLGLDYIRNALGGYELAEEFYADMTGVKPPPDWDKLGRDDKMVYFARKKIMRRDLAFIDAWQWWRAHRVAGIVRRIKAELGEDKPLWAFTLTWEKGWQHGQDPVMMNDAGVDADALMLYEANAEQFNALLHDWNRYVHRSDAQLVVGDVIDWPLHQKNPAGPKEFYRRLVSAIDHVYSDGPAAGVFFHDLDRALWGRVGPWGTKGWMDEAKAAVKYFKSLPSSGTVAQPLRVPDEDGTVAR